METMFNVEQMMIHFQTLVFTGLLMVMLIPVVIGSVYTVVKLVFNY